MTEKKAESREGKVVLASGIEVKPVYRPEDIKDTGYEEHIGDPGQYPYVRGPYPLMYRDRPWTIRQYTGFHGGEDTNQRLKQLMKQGLSGLSIAFHLPTQMGIDSDHPLAEDDVGRVGVAIDTLRDMEDIFRGIPMGEVTTNMTINATAFIMMAMYIVTAEKQGVPRSQVSGTTQNDILKEYVARGAWILPPQPSIRIIGDTLEFCMKEAPKFNPVSVSPAHIFHAGATPAQEAAYGMEIAITYAEEVLRRGIPIDDFAHLFTFTFSTVRDIWEGVAKFRALRRIWARTMKERFGAKDPRSMLFRTSGGGAESWYTAEEPENNIVRAVCSALIASLGGAQSIGLNCYDEAFTIPTLKSQRLTIRTSQILADEAGLRDTADPLAGSYFVEWLTNRMEEKILGIMKDIEKVGGMAAAVQKGYIQKSVAEQAYRQQQQIESGQLKWVGVNEYVSGEKPDVELHKYDPMTRERQIEKLNRIKRERDSKKVQAALKGLGKAVASDENVMPHVIEAVRCYATVGEIMNIFRDRFGEFKEPGIF